MSKQAAGWAYAIGTRKQHWFVMPDASQSIGNTLCGLEGKWTMASRLSPVSGAPAHECKTCRRKLDKQTPAPTNG